MKQKVRARGLLNRAIYSNTLMGKCHLRRVHLLPANTDFYVELQYQMPSFGYRSKWEKGFRNVNLYVHDVDCYQEKCNLHAVLEFSFPLLSHSVPAETKQPYLFNHH